MKAVSKKQIEDWKIEHKTRAIHEIEIPEDGLRCYLKSPTRKILSFAAASGAQDPLKFNEVILEKCWIAGDEDIKTDDVLFMSVNAQIASVIEIKNSTIKKH